MIRRNFFINFLSKIEKEKKGRIYFIAFICFVLLITVEQAIDFSFWGPDPWRTPTPWYIRIPLHTVEWLISNGIMSLLIDLKSNWGITKKSVLANLWGILVLLVLCGIYFFRH